MRAKKVYLEILRVIAIFFVLYVHTGIDAVEHYNIAGSRGSYYLSMVMNCVCRICNMLFIMISGVLLLDDTKQERISVVLKKRVLKMILVLIVFSLIQYTLTYLKYPEIGFEFPIIFRIMYSQPVITQYWYLYAYIGFLLFLPLLRLLAGKMGKRHFVYWTCLYVLWKGIMPVLERYMEYDKTRIELPFLEMIIFLPILGYGLEYIVWDFLQTKKGIILVNLAAAVALVWSVYEAQYTLVNRGEAKILEGLIVILAMALYVDVKALCTRFTMPKSLCEFWMFMGSGVFGVYLLEPQLREGFHFVYTMLEPYITWFPATVVWLLVAMMPGILGMNLYKIIAGMVSNVVGKRLCSRVW